MNITVIICTYNRGQRLAKALDHIAASILPTSVEWEILVVDNNSCDQTHEVVENFCLRDPTHFRYLFEPQQGLSYARNAGIQEARGEILAFVDDDDVVEPGWLSNLTSVLHSGEWAGAGGQIVPAWPKPIPKWLATDLATLGAYGQFNPSTEAGPLMRPPYGGNMAFRKEMFERYGGFRVDLGRSGTNLQGREDIEFGNRLLAGGERLWYEPRAVVRAIIAEHRVEKSYALRWWYWYGRSEVADLGPPEARWCISGVPLFLIRKLGRWSLQWLISIGASRRFISQRTVWYLFGTIVACHKRSWRHIPPVEIVSTPSKTSTSQTDGGQLSHRDGGVSENQ